MLKYIDYIYAVYQERSITKAAKKLYISQPWLSNIVKKVEEELQTPIFKRGSGALKLTEAGEFYIKHIEEIIRIRDEMNHYFYKQDSSAVTTIRIGSGSIFCIYILPKLLKKFCEDHPNILISFHEGANDDLTEKLLNHQIDIYIESDAPSNPDIKTITWTEEELLLAVPAKNPLNAAVSACAYTSKEYKERDSLPEKPFLPLAVMRNVPFVSASPGNDSYQRGIDICLESGFKPNIQFYCSSQLTSYSMACQGIGATFTRSVIPDFLPETQELKFYRLDTPLAMRNLYIAYAADQTNKHVKELISTIQETELSAFM